MVAPDITRRGVYYDLSLSPWEFKTAHGDILKFSSKKKLEIYRRELPLKLIDLTKACLKVNSLTGSMECDTEHLVHLVEIELYREVMK